MIDPFESPKRKLARAKQHLSDLDAGVNAFLDPKPWAQVAEPDATGMYELHKIKFTSRLSESLSDFAADTADALRSALDQACYAVAASVRDNPRHTHFPFADTAAGIDEALEKRQSRHIPPELRPLLRAFKPYKGGNDALWGLNRMRVANQHRMLTPTAIAATQRGIQHFYSEGSSSLFPPRLDRDKQEIIFAAAQPNSGLSYNMRLEFTVAFDDVEIFSGKPAVRVLDYLGGMVERIVLSIEAESRRLGFTA